VLWLWVTREVHAGALRESAESDSPEADIGWVDAGCMHPHEDLISFRAPDWDGTKL
jgi:hypothetical protein